MQGLPFANATGVIDFGNMEMPSGKPTGTKGVQIGYCVDLAKRVVCTAVLLSRGRISLKKGAGVSRGWAIPGNERASILESGCADDGNGWEQGPISWSGKVFCYSAFFLGHWRCNVRIL